MSYAAAAQEEAEDRYYTQVDAGDVRLFTLDQLDAAFNAGLIHENTYVCLEGDSQWRTLGDVAGLGDEDPAPAADVAQVPHRGVAAAPSVLPTYSAPYSVPPSIAPVVNDLSLGDFDADVLSMRPKRRVGKIVAGLAVLAAGGLGFMVVQSGGLRGLKLPGLVDGVGQSAAASLSLSNLKEISPHVETASRVDAVKPAPAPVIEASKPEAPRAEEPKLDETAAAASDKGSTSDKGAEPEGAADEAGAGKKGESRFSDEMKAALLKKDEQQAAPKKSKKSARAAVASKRKISKASKSSTGFKSSGSAYDPLNGKL